MPDELKCNVYYLEIIWPDYDSTTWSTIGVYSSLELAKNAAAFRFAKLIETYDMPPGIGDRVYTDTITKWEPCVAEKLWVSEIDSALDCYFEIRELELDATW